MYKYDTYKVFMDHFKKGDKLIIVDSKDQAHFGILQNVDLHVPGVRLKKGIWRRTFTIPWNEVVFVGHEGFPLRKISNITYDHAKTISEIIAKRDEISDNLKERIDILKTQVPTQRNIGPKYDRNHYPGSLRTKDTRPFFNPRKFPERPSRCRMDPQDAEEEVEERQHGGHRIWKGAARGGDPFEFENVNITLLNPFCDELYHINFLPCYKETLFLESILDEAKGMWFDLAGIYDLELKPMEIKICQCII